MTARHAPEFPMYQRLRDAFARLVADNDLGGDTMQVTCARLTAEQAIGRPRHDDYPLVRGREFMVEAKLGDSAGQAFTDTWRGDYVAELKHVVELPLEDNYARSLFIAGLNAVCRSLGLVEATVHCKDDEPLECAAELADHVARRHPTARKVLLVGCQPRMIETLATRFELRVNDLDPANIGTQKAGVTIGGPDALEANLAWAECAVVTGTTVVNGSLDDFCGRLPTIHYGVTIAGAAHILGLDRFCLCGR